MRAVEAGIGRIAGEQDNVIRLEQLLGLGLGRGAIADRCRTGRLQHRHRGVYLVGPAPPSFAGRARAAVYAVGAGGVVGLGAAAVLLGLRPEPSTEASPIDILVARGNAVSRPGIVVHRTSLVRAEFGYVCGIPVTSAARTICDHAASGPMREVEQLLIDARRARIVTDAELYAVLDRVRHRKGHAAVRALLADEIEEGYSRSRAERKLRKLVRDADLPVPLYNRKVRGLLVDAVWRELRFVVEVDGRKDHGTAWAFENDRLRDQILAAAGYTVIRVTWRQLVQQPMAVAVRIAQALVWAERAA
jgi:very-short-patch-repair endonuclease